MSRTELASLTAATAVVAILIVLAVYALSAGSDNHVSLEGIEMSELDLDGGELLIPQGDAILSAVQAQGIVLNAKRAQTAGDDLPPPKIRETLLVRYVRDTIQPPVDALAWAVNLDPETVSPANLRSGMRIADLCCPAPIGQTPAPTPEPTPLNCGLSTVYNVVLIDAHSGEWLFEAKSTELVEPAPGETCPPTPTPNVPSVTPTRLERGLPR